MLLDGAVRRSSAACRVAVGIGAGAANCVLFWTNGEGAQAASVVRIGTIAASAIYDGAFRSDLLEITDAKRSPRTVPQRPTDMPHPQTRRIRQPIGAEPGLQLVKGNANHRFTWGVAALLHP